jgi:hypothetical protein
MSVNGRQLLTADQVDHEIDQLLLDGIAQTASEAEEKFLDAHLEDIAELANQLNDQEFRNHPAVKLLLSHGSRPWEDGAL